MKWCANCGHSAAAHEEDSPERASLFAYLTLPGARYPLCECLLAAEPTISAPPQQSQAMHIPRHRQQH